MTNMWLPWWLRGKESACQYRRGRLDPCVRKIPWRRKWQSIPIFLPGESHRLRSLVGYSPQGRKESDTTERLHFHLIHFFVHLSTTDTPNPDHKHHSNFLTVHPHLTDKSCPFWFLKDIQILLAGNPNVMIIKCNGRSHLRWRR